MATLYQGRNWHISRVCSVFSDDLLLQNWHHHRRALYLLYYFDVQHRLGGISICLFPISIIEALLFYPKSGFQTAVDQNRLCCKHLHLGTHIAHGKTLMDNEEGFMRRMHLLVILQFTTVKWIPQTPTLHSGRIHCI